MPPVTDSTRISKAEKLIHMVPEHLRGSEITISPARAVLLLLNISRQFDEKDSLELRGHLEKLFIQGVTCTDDKNFMTQLVSTYEEQGIYVDTRNEAIENDSIKRHFETNLSREILRRQAGELDHDQLQLYFENLLKHFKKFGAPSQPRILKVLSGEISDDMINYEKEFADLIRSLDSKNYQGLPADACENLATMARFTALSTRLTGVDKKLAANIYDDSIFSMDLGGRGRLKKPGHEDVRTGAKGLMRSKTPVSVYDEALYQAPNSDGSLNVSPMQRPADQSLYMKGSTWNTYFFNNMMQVYSNGISSTTLGVTRNLISQKRKGNPHFAEDLQPFLTSFAAMIAYTGGGHSFFEVLEVLKLPFARELTENIDGFEALVENNTLMYQWLCLDQRAAFDEALTKSIEYSDVLLKKQAVALEFKRKLGKAESTVLPGKTEKDLHEFVISNDLEGLESALESGKFNVNQRAYGKWTPLMVASQLGHIECVRLLLDHKCNVHARANHLTALELAIRYSQLEVVKELLDSGATLNAKVNVKSEPSKLKRNSLALYHAVRQSNQEILNLVLQNVPNTPDLITPAVKEAIKFENMSAITTMVDTLSGQPGFGRLFSSKDKMDFLVQAVSTGNAGLVLGLIDTQFHPDETIQIRHLIQLAHLEGYSPLANQLYSYALSVGDDSINDSTLAEIYDSIDLSVLDAYASSEPNELQPADPYHAGADIGYDEAPTDVAYLPSTQFAKLAKTVIAARDEQEKVTDTAEIQGQKNTI